MWNGPDGELPIDIHVLRAIGLFFLALILVETVTAHPAVAAHGDGLAIAFGVAAVLAGVAVSDPRASMSARRRVVGLSLLTAGGLLLAIFQPNGAWLAVAYYVAILSAMRLDERPALAMLVVSLGAFVTVAAVQGRWGQVLGVIGGAVPWFIVLRLIRRMREAHLALKLSQASEARAAADAERGRLAREMHDVLAHSLSALALQLETTRLLAREHGVDADVTQAIDQAHHLAVGGLDEARHAISAARGDELPGPERLAALAAAFSEQSGVPVDVEVVGAPHALAPDARLAIYRTAQEALTNVRRHAVPDRVQVRLRYDDDGTVLTVEDRGAATVPVAVGPPSGPGGYGLTGMRERAELLGGRLAAEPIDGGFRVQLWLPAT